MNWILSRYDLIVNTIRQKKASDLPRITCGDQRPDFSEK